MAGLFSGPRRQMPLPRRQDVSFFTFSLDISQKGAIIILHLRDAGVAHPVERHLAKVEVASSSLVTRSINAANDLFAAFFVFYRQEAKYSACGSRCPRQKRPRRNESSRSDASYSLSSFLPFQNANASLVCVLVFGESFLNGVGADAYIGPLGNHRIRRRVSRFERAFCRADRGVRPYNKR